MRHRMLTLAARHPLAALFSMVLLVLAGASALLATALGSTSEADPAERAENEAGSPRAILSRIWFDKYPQKRNEEVQVLIFLAGGIGITEKGSSYRYAVDVFEFERQGDKVSLKFLHDKKAAETKFTVSACDEKPPFDLCLDLENSPFGQKRYYGFGSADDMAQNVPWSPAVMKSAESRAAAR
ncbi:hypothetical protein [Chondromyces apiculatus]|uniref:Uncharacterized protein n=1 Tax=Chondromyces apiculatus DSM 436 TaxID=1192034 RepID=A0A017TH58_9BACT|nr:hypothetical protein [Chondromyces apiculatus]EYF08267.1 Hypothetical protein CAP_6028 [Chondromyces apiculatus DSM 436]